MNDLINPRNTVGEHIETPKNIGGRLRKHDRDDIACKLIEWAKLSTSINLCKFCFENEIVPQKLSEWSKENDMFREALQFARVCLGFRREEKLNSGEIHTVGYNLNASTYDYFLKEEKREEKSYEAELKKGILDNNIDILVETITYAKHLKDKLIATDTENKINPSLQV